jgi:hypothetical protein
MPQTFGGIDRERERERERERLDGQAAATSEGEVNMLSRGREDLYIFGKSDICGTCVTLNLHFIKMGNYVYLTLFHIYDTEII